MFLLALVASSHDLGLLFSLLEILNPTDPCSSPSPTICSKIHCLSSCVSSVSSPPSFGGVAGGDSPPFSPSVGFSHDRPFPPPILRKQSSLCGPAPRRPFPLCTGRLRPSPSHIGFLPLPESGKTFFSLPDRAGGEDLATQSLP